jgi:hypothetical protein
MAGKDEVNWKSQVGEVQVASSEVLRKTMSSPVLPSV